MDDKSEIEGLVAELSHYAMPGGLHERTAAALTSLQNENEGFKREVYAASCALTNMRTQLAAAEARAEKAEGRLSRKGFPILGSRGASIDWQLVSDHGEQAHKNHGQTVAGLAGRGGLSWCELHAVLHDRRWQKMDANDAMIACRALEARYLAALPADAGEGK